VRLACVKHAASVHSEPGSNSPIKLYSKPNRLLKLFDKSLTHYHYLVFKDQKSLRGQCLLPSKNSANLYDLGRFVNRFFIFFQDRENFPKRPTRSPVFQKEPGPSTAAGTFCQGLFQTSLKRTKKICRPLFQQRSADPNGDCTYRT
jgi:hypothetical protein